MISEDQLIEKCRNNDRAAQKTLYNKYAALLLGICVSTFREIQRRRYFTGGFSEDLDKKLANLKEEVLLKVG